MDLFKLRLRWSCARAQRRAGLVADESGASAVEFALVLPAMCLLLFGIIKLGLVLGNYIQLTNAAAAGGRQMAVSRTSNTPYTNTVNALRAAAPNLSTASMGITVTVDSNTCSTDATCAADLANSALSATVALTYPCDLVIFTAGLRSCSLSSSSTGAVQ